MQAVLKFVETRQCEAKKGLFVWGDNDPYNADANAILQRLPFFKGAVAIFITTFRFTLTPSKGSVSLNGNFMADRILTEHPAPTAMRAQGHSGFKPHHITTGLESLCGRAAACAG